MSTRAQKGIALIPVVIIIAVAAVTIAGGAYWYVSQNTQANPTTARSATNTTPPQFVIFKDFIVNLLADENEEMHFMQLDVALVTRSSPCHKALENNLPILRNALLDLFSSWTFDDIQNPKNRDQLRQQAVNALHRLTGIPHIQALEGVLITNLVVQ